MIQDLTPDAGGFPIDEWLAAVGAESVTVSSETGTSVASLLGDWVEVFAVSNTAWVVFCRTSASYPCVQLIRYNVATNNFSQAHSAPVSVTNSGTNVLKYNDETFLQIINGDLYRFDIDVDTPSITATNIHAVDASGEGEAFSTKMRMAWADADKTTIMVMNSVSDGANYDLYAALYDWDGSDVTFVDQGADTAANWPLVGGSGISASQNLPFCAYDESNDVIIYGGVQIGGSANIYCSIVSHDGATVTMDYEASTSLTSASDFFQTYRHLGGPFIAGMGLSTSQMRSGLLTVKDAALSTFSFNQSTNDQTFYENSKCFAHNDFDGMQLYVDGRTTGNFYLCACVGGMQAALFSASLSVTSSNPVGAVASKDGRNILCMKTDASSYLKFSAATID